MNATQRRQRASLRRERIRELLAEKKITTVTAQAEYLGMHRATYSDLMSKRALPSLAAALRMAKRLGVQVEDIAELTEAA